MLADVLSKVLPALIDCLVKREPVSISGYEETEILQMLPKLNEHKLESIALLSLSGMSALSSFYISTYLAQFNAIRSRLAEAMNAAGCIFLQGFPRCLDFSDFYTPGMRSDVDVYVPESSLVAFRNAAFAAGFDYYGFDDKNVFVVSQDQSDSLIAGNWASKDVTLTYLQEVNLPLDLPIEIDDCYLPYLIRNGKTLLMVSIEVHHFYTDPSDICVLENAREFWEQMGADRCGLEATLYFNLIRLYKGVFAGENRMRLLLDTACLLLDHQRPLDSSILDSLISSSAMHKEITSVCSALEHIHPIFTKMTRARPNFPDSNIAKNWLENFYASLRIGIENEK